MRIKLTKLPVEIVNDFEKAISLRVIDTNWMNHINDMEHLRERKSKRICK